MTFLSFNQELKGALVKHFHMLSTALTCDGKTATSTVQQFQKAYKLLRLKHISNREINILIFITESQEPVTKIVCVIFFPVLTFSVKTGWGGGQQQGDTTQVNK